MKALKQLLSTVLCLALILSCALFPAAAAGAATLSLSQEGSSTVSTGEQVTVLIETDANAVDTFSAVLSYDTNVLTYSKYQAADIDSIQVNGKVAGQVTAKAMSAENVTSTTGIELVRIVFTVNSDVESGTYADVIFFDAKGSQRVTYYDEQAEDSVAYTTSTSGSVSLTVNGVAPALNTVRLDKETVQVNGTAGGTVTASASSAKGTDLTNNASLTWTVAPTGKGVTISGNTVTVGAKAEAGTYTVTAAGDGTNVTGSASATFTVTRAAASVQKVEVQRDGNTVTSDTLIIPTSGSRDYTYTAKVTDQYDAVMNTVAVNWTLATADSYVSNSGGVVTVKAGATKNSTYNLTATAGGKNATVAITVKDIDITWPTATKNSGTYGDTWSQIVTLSGGSASLNGVNVPGTFALKDPSGKPDAGSPTYVINFKSTDGQYDVDSAPMQATVAKLEAQLTWTDGDLVYDGNPKNVTAEVSNLLAGDACTVTVSGGNAVDVGPHTATATALSNPNYQLPATATHDYTITGATVTVTGITVSGKEYDGNTNAAVDVSAAVFTGKVAGDDLSVTATGAFADKHVGAGKADSVNLARSGADAGKYSLSASSQKTATADITAKTVTVSGITARNKGYDGSTNATVDVSAAVITGKVDGDDLSVSATGVFADAEKGTGKTVDLTITLTGADAGNYLLDADNSQKTTDANITEAEVTVSGITVSNKEYDGTTAATVDVSGAVITGAPANANLTVNATGAFADKNVATGKTVTLTVTLGGADAANYALSDSSQTTATADITAKSVTVSGITAAGKEYDGNTDATVDASAAVITGKVDGDTLSATATGAVSDKNVGTGKTVTVTATLTGTDAANYKLDSAPTVTADITAKTVTVSGITVEQKEYDGTTDAVINTDAAVFTGMVDGDNLTVTATAAFADAEVGTGKTVTLSGLALGGADAGNYTLDTAGSQTTATGNIIPAQLTGTVVITASESPVVSGVTLTADISGLNTQTGLTYQWQRDGADISGETGLTYTVTDDDIGKTLTIVVTASGNYTGTATASIDAGKVTLAGTLSITYTDKKPEVGTKLTAKDNLAPAVEGTDYDLVWLRDGKPIKGATGKTYTVTSEDQGKKITVKAVAKGDHFTGEVVSSNSVTIASGIPTFDAAPKVKAGNDYLTVELNANDNGSPIKYYEIVIFDGNHTWSYYTDGAKTSYTIKPLLPGTEYTIYVKATNANGTGYSPVTVAKTTGKAPQYYGIIVLETKHGTVTVKPEWAARGETIKITIKPDRGYELSGLSVLGANDREIKVKEEKDGTLSFTMPASVVRVKATFSSIVKLPFTDVPDGVYYYDAVAWAVEKGVTTGATDTTFSPNTNCTRAQMVTFLYRAAGSPRATGTMPFTDVHPGDYYYNAILWAYQKGIAIGVSATSFSPNTMVTRAQVVTFLYRYIQSEGGGFKGTWAFPLNYSDVADVPDYAYEAFCYLTMEEIVNGINGALKPNLACSRAQIVTLLYRYFA